MLIIRGDLCFRASCHSWWWISSVSWRNGCNRLGTVSKRHKCYWGVFDGCSRTYTNTSRFVCFDFHGLITRIWKRCCFVFFDIFFWRWRWRRWNIIIWFWPLFFFFFFFCCIFGFSLLCRIYDVCQFFFVLLSFLPTILVPVSCFFIVQSRFSLVRGT